MKLISILTYNMDLEVWDIDCINNIAKTYNKVSKGITLQLQHLQDEELEEI